MKKYILYSLIFLGLLIGPRGLVFAEEQKGQKKNTNPIRSIEGELTLVDDSLFLITSNKGSFKLAPNLNPANYNSLLDKFKGNSSQGKGVKAKITGQVSGGHVKSAYKYASDAQAPYAAEETKYWDFSVADIKSVSDCELNKDLKPLAVITPNPLTPDRFVPRGLKSVRTKIIGAYFNKVVPYIEVKVGNNKKAIIVPTGIQVVKVVEGQLMSFAAKDVLKVKDKCEIWYEEKGDVNIAKVITILSDAAIVK